MLTHHAACRIIVIGMQLAYYGAAAIKIRDYTFKDTHGRATYTPVPDWGWILETVAGVLWLIIAAISACTLFPSLCALSDAHAALSDAHAAKSPCRKLCMCAAASSVLYVFRMVPCAHTSLRGACPDPGCLTASSCSDAVGTACNLQLHLLQSRDLQA